MVIAGIYEYLEGNIVLNIPIPQGLPEFIQLDSHQLSLKAELHVTLVNTSRTALLVDETNARTIELEIIKTFKQFITSHPLDNYKLLKDFRFVQRGDNKTVIALAYVDNLKEFYDELRTKYKKDISGQPTHATIYTLIPSKGIGLNSNKTLEQDSRPISIKELQDIKFVKERSGLNSSGNSK